MRLLRRHTFLKRRSVARSVSNLQQLVVRVVPVHEIAETAILGLYRFKLMFLHTSSGTHTVGVKNVSNIVQFRFIKWYFPFGSFPVFGGFTIRFLSHVSYRSVLFRLCARLHNGAEIVGRASHSATLTFKKRFARLFFVSKSVKNMAGKQQVLQRGSLSSTKRAAFRLRAVLRGRYETKGTVCERSVTSFGNVALRFRADFCSTKRYCIERYWKRFFDSYCRSLAC